MIAINELRISNWINVIIHSNFKDIKVVWLGKVKAISSAILIEYRDSKEPIISEETSLTIEPIMLTRDWLKRAHFQTVEESETFETMQFNRFEISFYKENGSVIAMANKVIAPFIYSFLSNSLSYGSLLLAGILYRRRW